MSPGRAWLDRPTVGMATHEIISDLAELCIQDTCTVITRIARIYLFDVRFQSLLLLVHLVLGFSLLTQQLSIERILTLPSRKQY